MRAFYKEHRQSMHIAGLALLLVLAWQVPVDVIAGTLRLWLAVIFVFFVSTYYGDQIGDYVTNLLHGGTKDGESETASDSGKQEQGE